MKKRICILLAMLSLAAACAKAQPQLSAVFASDAALVAGQDGWYFDFQASEGGTMAKIGRAHV